METKEWGNGTPGNAAVPIPELRKEYEARCREIIFSTLDKHGGVKNRAAIELGMNRTTLIEWLRVHAPERVGTRQGGAQ